ncbi:MAG: amylo-alpha-1,6-glucosidase [Candidatus Thiodiazotropha sp.]
MSGKLNETKQGNGVPVDPSGEVSRVPSGIRFGRAICGVLEQAEQREWWLSDGQGGYAGGTLAGSLTRRYHGLLISAAAPGEQRRLLVAKADATLEIAGRSWPLFTNRWYGKVIEPAGYRHLEHFQLLGRMPCWHFACDEYYLEMRVWMPAEGRTTYVAYRYRGGYEASQPVTLSVNLLTNRRDHHGNQPVNGTTAQVSEDGGRIRVEWPEGEVVHVQTTQAGFEPQQHWHEGFLLARETDRGLPDIDNNLSIGRLVYALESGQWAGFAVTLDEDHAFDLESSMQAFLQGEARLSNPSDQPVFEQAPDWVRQLLLAAHAFPIQRPLPGNASRASVIAGYPWFADWGRDTMIALPGLTLISGQLEQARGILMSYAELVDGGQLPNRLGQAGEEPAYNSVDATLWYFEAWRAYLEARDDADALQQVYPVLQAIIQAYSQGTRYGIGMDPQDGLLRAGEPGTQLTWMDAKVGNWVVTPRIGKPVEVNALWYHALRCMQAFAQRLNRPDEEYRDLAEQVRSGFQRFRRDGSGALYDVLDTPSGDDPRLRPNQILALSLEYSPLDPEHWPGVLGVCGHELLTSYGLRSLSPRDKDYRHHYQGGVADRDGAYHQGTVWAWLLGHYAWAEYRVSGDARLALRRLEPLADHLQHAGLGTISEIFDADPPHRPRGAPAQAWSVACTLQTWVRLQRVIQSERQSLE